ncbi:MAG TPA: oligosaccharide flippase family protein [Calditrichia bacterium]|nr:oligosaccharide flippase family protein [Calditrichota bacterium]HQU70716.1 oligosaccharide flippase family protein [Calditrichia bacterium]HQV31669.1 oligosaccharide flippase family protein [Calditrichia bacterium]
MKFIQRFKSDFFKNVLKLLSGTVLSSAISFLALPVITRLYSEADLGLFQAFNSIILILGGIASLKYELTIVLPKAEEEANHAVVLSLIVTLLFSAVSWVAFALFREPLFRFMEIEQLIPYANIIVLGILGYGILQITRFMLMRDKAFGPLARNNVYQSVAQHGGSIALGLRGGSFSGLFYAFIAGTLIPSLMVGITYFRRIPRPDWKRLKSLAWQYRKFPIFNTSNVFLNNFSLELPVFMMAVYFDEATIGLYSLAMRLLVVPLNLLGTSVSRVYFQAASEAYNESPGKLLALYKETVGKLSLIGLAPVVVILVAAPTLVALIFGENWREAGVYMQLLSVALYFRFVNSPISTTFSIIDKQEMALFLTGGSVVIRYLAMYLNSHSPLALITALSVATAIFYAAYNFTIYYFVRKLADGDASAGKT